MIDYKYSYKSTQVRLITKYLGPCTQAPHTDVLAKQTDTLRVLRKVLLNIQNNRI